MVKCLECGTELPPGAKFCFSCGAQVGLKKEAFQVSSEKLLEKFKELTKDATVKRVVIKDDKGKVVLSIPLAWGAAGAVATLALAPWLAAMGVIAGIATKCTIEVERMVS
jgi:DNA-directed RNA polymerase subunit N (RpoN/RPB10)